MPNLINEANSEKILNYTALKNSQLISDIKNPIIKPDYKLNLNFSADNISLKYPNKTDFITIENPNIEISLISLLYGYIDINKIKAKKIQINATFTKQKKYSCLKYFYSKQSSKNAKFKIRNLNLYTEDFSLNLYDENLKKDFYIKSSKLKIDSSEYKKPLSILSKGTIKSSNHKISDFNLNLSIKLNPNSVGKFKEKIFALNYNPLKYADEYKFYTQSDINLKIIPNNKKTDITGEINLRDLIFSIDNITLPKNNVSLKFKTDKIYTDCDFKLLKNQNIKIKANAILSKNKFIETSLISNEIDFADLKDILNAFCKIFNQKINLKDILITGKMNVDLYLKSNFKTLNSKGKLKIQNAQIEHIKTGLILKNINSDINLENNIVNIVNASAFINNAKFNLSGIMDSKTNLNLAINSEPINIAQIITFIKELPLLSTIAPSLNDYNFKDGLLKINSTIKGNLKNPIIKTNSNLDNFSAYSKKFKTNINIKKANIVANPQKTTLKEILITSTGLNLNYQNKTIKSENVNLKILDKDILLPKTNFTFEKIPVSIEGIIKNYNSNNCETQFKIYGNLPKNNDLIALKKQSAKFTGAFNLKSDNISITSFNIFDEKSNFINITGAISNISKEPVFNEIKINIAEKTGILLSKINNINFDIIGNIILDGKIKNPNINGKLNIYNLYSNELNLKAHDVLLNAKNSEFYINIEKGTIFDCDFDLIAQTKILQNKIIVNNVQFNSAYVNAENVQKYIQSAKTNHNDIEINNIQGHILTLETGDILLNSLNFKGNLKNNHLNISNFDAELLNGKIEGNANINLTNNNIKTELILKELNIRQLSNKLKELSIAASGKLSSLINAEFYGLDIDSILKTFNGNVDFNIDNGELSHFAKLERFLQAGNIVSQSLSKLTLNSTLSAITKQNTGDFKTIEGDIKIRNSIAKINYITTQGTNMSLYIEGNYNLLNNYADLQILGRIPNSMVSVMGNIGNFSFSKLDKNQTNNETYLEKKLSTQIPDEYVIKIPSLAYTNDISNTREFKVLINGISTDMSSIIDFKWNAK